jgi:hypothetical protein
VASIAVFLYCQILNNCYNNNDDNSLVSMTNEIISRFKKFLWINYRKYFRSDKNEDLSYAANSYNKLAYASIEHQTSS